MTNTAFPFGTCPAISYSNPNMLASVHVLMVPITTEICGVKN